MAVAIGAAGDGASASDFVEFVNFMLEIGEVFEEFVFD
jgi:hypothetical protein